MLILDCLGKALFIVDLFCEKKYYPAVPTDINFKILNNVLIVTGNTSEKANRLEILVSENTRGWSYDDVPNQKFVQRPGDERLLISRNRGELRKE